jgi:hypothetical protein
LKRRKLVSTNRIVHKPLRRSDGINFVGDVDVAITSNTGKGETSSSRVASRRRIVQRTGEKAERSGDDGNQDSRRSAEWEVRDRECEE